MVARTPGQAEDRSGVVWATGSKSLWLLNFLLD